MCYRWIYARATGIIWKGDFLRDYLRFEGGSTTQGVTQYLFQRAAAFAISYTVFAYHDARSDPSSLGGAAVRFLHAECAECKVTQKALVALLSLLLFGLTAMGMAWAAYELNAVVDEEFGYGPAALLLTSSNLNICLNGVPTNFTCMNSIVDDDIAK